MRLLPVTPGLCALCRGKGLTQSSHADTVGSSVPGPCILLPSPTADIWEKVGRKDGTGSHPLER